MSLIDALARPLPMVALIACVTALGLIFGSFVTALSYRLPRGISIAKGRSACPSCGTMLTPRDLVPVLSWVAHRGACRTCGTSISWRYPAIEITTAALFAIAATVIDELPRLVFVLAATPAMVALGVIDLEFRRLPNVLLAWLAVMALGVRDTIDGDFLTALIAAVIVFASALALDAAGRRVLRQGLGMGDAKLLAIVALALPLVPMTITLATSGCLGVLLGCAYRFRGARTFPFGPSILLALWIGLVTL